MKKYLFFIVFICAANLLQAQLPWTIRLGNKTILQSSVEDPVKNRLSLTTAQVGTKNNFTLSYKIPGDEKDWIRTIMINDSTGAGIAENMAVSKPKKSKAGMVYSVSNKTLKALLVKYRKISIWISSVPSDPQKAATVRMRPVHVCTITVR